MKLPGKLSELNIHYGVFVGGMGDFSQIFLGLLSPFRGCLADALFNGVHLLRVSRERGTTRGVSWRCSDQFAASAAATLVFTEWRAFAVLRPVTGAYSDPSDSAAGAGAVSVPSPTGPGGITIQLQLRTTLSDGLVLAGESGTSDRLQPGRQPRPAAPHRLLVKLLLRSGKLRLSITSGGDLATHLDSATSVVDGEWHQVTVSISATSSSLSVDGGEAGQVTLSAPELRALQRLVLGSPADRRPAANSSEGFLGCLRGVRVDGRPLGFPQVTESESVVTSCEAARRCAEGKCGEAEHCERGLGEQCPCGDDCDSGVVNAPADSPAKEDMNVSNKLFSSSSVKVIEGSESRLTARNIRPNFNLTQYNISASELAFSVRVAPTEGELRSADDGGVVRRFMLHELRQGAVRYVHSGSELTRDRLELQPELPSASPLALDVLVTPVDDPPRLTLTEDGGLTVPAGARLPLDSDLVRVSDPDTPPDRLLVLVATDGAVVELTGRPGQVAEEFTLPQLEGGEVEVVLSPAAAAAQLTLRTSDGRSRSAAVQLRLITFRCR